MLRNILFDVRFFDKENGKDQDISETGILWLLEALVQWDMKWLKANPKTPALYRSGVKYKLPEQFEKADVPEIGELRALVGNNSKAQALIQSLSNMLGGGEHFRDIQAIIDNGGGDCDNVSTWRVAELRNQGINAMPYITHRKKPDGTGTVYHAVVLWPELDKLTTIPDAPPSSKNGGMEDPSLLLGMGGESRAADRAEEVRKNKERFDTIKAKKGPVAKGLSSLISKLKSLPSASPGGLVAIPSMPEPLVVPADAMVSNPVNSGEMPGADYFSDVSYNVKNWNAGDLV